jgi:hypothetical protein
MVRGRSGRSYANAQEPLPGVSVAQVAEHRGKYHVAHHEGCLQQSQVLVYKEEYRHYLKNSNTPYTVPILSFILYTGTAQGVKPPEISIVDSDPEIFYRYPPGSRSVIICMNLDPDSSIDL